MAKAKIVKPTDSVVPTITEVEMPANFLINELEGNKLVDQKIKEMVRGFILEDKSIDKEIEKVVDKIEKERIKIFWTKIGFGIWSFLMVVFGAFLPLIIDYLRR
jgi:hypothetical protein